MTSLIALTASAFFSLSAMTASNVSLGVGEESALPSRFNVSEVALNFLLNCPWDHRRAYTLDGSGKFRFSDTARNEDQPDKEHVVSTELDVGVDDVGKIVALLLESSFPYLPSTVGDIYLVRDGMVSRGNISVSTACEAEITLEIGEYRKAVTYQSMQLIPADFVRSLQQLSGEVESEQDLEPDA